KLARLWASALRNSGELRRVVAFRVKLNIGLPASGRHRLFEAQPTDDFLDVSVNALVGRHKGGDDNALRSREIVAVKPAQRQPAAGKALQEERSNVRLIQAAACDR